MGSRKGVFLTTDIYNHLWAKLVQGGMGLSHYNLWCVDAVQPSSVQRTKGFIKEKELIGIPYITLFTLTQC